jgi:ribosome biogenesis protein Tsr3
MIAKIHSVRKAEQHVLIDPESQESLNHLEETMRRKNELTILEPSINW